MNSLIKTLAVTLAFSLTASAQEDSVIRVNSTIQKYNQGQPWAKTAPRNRRGLAAYIGENRVLTTAELVADVANLEFETVDGNRRIPAEVSVIDYEANLAILKPLASQDLNFLKPLEIAKESKIGNEVTVLQMEASGEPLKTKGEVRSVELISSFVPGHYFLTYEVKASMQSAASSYTIPVFQEGKLLGILTSYNSKDQLLDVTAPEIINAFLEDAADGKYEGFPLAGILTEKTTDPNLRSWLKLDDTQGGLYITSVARKSPALRAGIKKGDVLLSIDGETIDRQGYFKSKKYGKLHWSHLTRARHKMGDDMQVTISRNGKEQKLVVKLNSRPESIIPSHMHDKAPKYLVKGGMIFQELNEQYLQIFGKDWKSRAPLSLLDVVNHPEDYEEGRNRVVFLSAVIPNKATVGYERLRSIVVKKVNGKEIADISSLYEAFESKKNGIHKIELNEEPKEIYLSVEDSNQEDATLLERGLPALYRK